MLRPTPGDPWGVEQHHWNTGAKENQQLNPGGPSSRDVTWGRPCIQVDNSTLADCLTEPEAMIHNEQARK